MQYFAPVLLLYGCQFPVAAKVSLAGPEGNMEEIRFGPAVAGLCDCFGPCVVVTALLLRIHDLIQPFVVLGLVPGLAECDQGGAG